ncbi:MAG: porin family protein [Alphaproteobacteria bacterium]|nr:porin family protein [Alphaproteobacteria bacterium]
MKKAICLLCVLLFVTSVQAKPFRSGLYLGLKGGAGVAKIHTPWADDLSKKDKKNAAFAMAAAVGVRIRHFRLELEYMMMNKQKGSGSYEQEIDTLMAQGYFDLPFKSAIRPFINLGAGIYTADFERKHEWSDDSKAFTWSGGAGLTWAISSATNLDIGYRYLDIGDFKTRDGTVKQDNHIFYLGWRHVF